jgi:hypothetical protein
MRALPLAADVTTIHWHGGGCTCASAPITAAPTLLLLPLVLLLVLLLLPQAVNA